MLLSWIRRLFRKFTRGKRKARFGTNESDTSSSHESSMSDRSVSQGSFTDDDNDGFGMHVFVDKPDHDPNIVDFVALHGLNGHYRNTWTATSPVDGRRVNWLKDLLPRVIRNARVMSFGYNSVVQFSKGTAGINEFAEQLLEALMTWRSSPEEKRRPVIFICHSLGGIVFKQAVVRARERDRFTGLLESIRGVAFFGTPHCGSSAAGFGAMLASILKISTLGTNTNSRLVSQLKKNAKTLLAINSSFVDRSKNLDIISFYETEKMDYMQKLVVDKKSAVMEVQDEAAIALNANHHSICKFGDKKGERQFRVVSSRLKEMADAMLLTHVTHTETILESKDQNACFQSFFHENYEDYMNRNPARAPGTCEWLLRHEKYHKWIATNSRSRLLWVSADPGCGKSVLAKFLVTHLRVPVSGYEYQRPRLVAHFFFKDDNEGQRNAVFALRAVLHQIFINDRKLLRHAFDDYVSIGTAMVDDFASLWGILSRVAVDPAAKDIILIFDAIDECETTSQRRLLQGLRKWFSKATKVRPFLKVVLLSRPNNIIEDIFTALPTVRLRREDEPESISNDVELVIRSQIGDLASKGIPPQDLIWLQEALIEKADRTFLWTALMIGLLLDAARAGFSRTGLEDLLGARDIDGIYFKLLCRGDSLQRKETRKLLQLILAAAVPLSLDRLNVGLVADPKHNGIQDLNKDLKSSMEKYVKHCCGNFVRIIRSEVFLVHQTARTFLLQQQQSTTSLWKRQLTIEGSNNAILMSCISSLLLVALETKSDTVQFDQLEMPREITSFFDYASHFWSTHIQERSVEMFNQIVDRCLTISTQLASKRCQWLPAHNLVWWLGTWDHSMSDTSWSVLEVPLARLLDNAIVDVNACDSPGSDRGLLHRAAEYGSTNLSQALLEHGAKASLKDEEGNTPLHLFMRSMKRWKSRNQDALDIRQFLRGCLDNDADIDARNNEGQTPLHLAATYRLEVALRELVDIGADVTATTESGDTPLQLAVKNEDNTGCIRLLLEHDRDPDVVNLYHEIEQGNSNGVIDILQRDSTILDRKEVKRGALRVLRRQPTMTDLVGDGFISENSEVDLQEDTDSLGGDDDVWER